MHIPEGFGVTDDYPRSVPGKIMYMTDIGKALIEDSDKLIKIVSGLQRRRAEWAAASASSGPSAEEALLSALSRYVVKLATLTALQTECIEQLYGELRPPLLG